MPAQLFPWQPAPYAMVQPVRFPNSNPPLVTQLPGQAGVPHAGNGVKVQVALPEPPQGVGEQVQGVVLKLQPGTVQPAISGAGLMPNATTMSAVAKHGFLTTWLASWSTGGER